MPQISLPDVLLDHDEIRRLSMQSLFESLESLCEGTVVVDRDARIVWINEPVSYTHLDVYKRQLTLFLFSKHRYVNRR